MPIGAGRIPECMSRGSTHTLTSFEPQSGLSTAIGDLTEVVSQDSARAITQSESSIAVVQNTLNIAVCSDENTRPTGNELELRTETVDYLPRIPSICRYVPSINATGSSYILVSLDEWIVDCRLVLSQSVHKPRLDQVAILKALEGLRYLPANWNGYNASPIDKRIIDAAKRIIRSLPSDIVATPSVVPMTRGRLQFEWHRGNRSLELELESRDRIHYLKWDSDEGIEEEDSLSINDTDKVRALLHWFASECANDRGQR